MLAEFAPLEGRILAGGQSLVRMMAFRMARPAHLIDINSVAGFDRLSVDGNTLSIAPCLRHAAFHRAAAPGPTGGLLSSVVRNIAHYPIRLRGTFCGSLAHVDPASEWCLTAATLGRRRGPARSPAHRRRRCFHRHHGDEDELLVEARVSLLAPNERFVF
jgi:aerobic carbon-monoxide dehydrogenase medium subunit